MRVVLVNKFHYRKGGSETYYFAVADALREMGHEVHFFAMEDEKNLPCTDADLFVPNRDYNGPSSPVAKASAALSIVYSGEAKRRFQTLCERVRPDVVHMNLVHRQITLSILDAPYLREHHVPVVWTAHDYIAVCPSYTMLDGAGEVCEACLGEHFSNCLKRKCIKGSAAKSGLAMLEAGFLRRTHAYRKIDRIICPSQFLESKMAEGGFSTGQLVWMPNFLPGDALATVGDRAVSGKEPYFLYLGRLSKEKGVDVLIESFARAWGEGKTPGWRLVIAGDGPERDRLERLAAARGLGGTVRFAGYVAGTARDGLLYDARYACVPSVWNENAPYSVLEAMAAGVPVIGSRIGGIPELVHDRVTGLLFRPGDTGSLAGLIGRAASMDTEAYEAMSRGCRAFAASECSEKKYMEDLVMLYGELIAEKRGN
ncbi:glycosyltransferase [Collinsella sp. An2]|uniref:glycosyltransferase n=1 Tax=Collinsella sp. An2 TaxID=1965585 RepID=UPI000B3773F3|nr:glycosyltransferase [Collinsella sp. An2]OUP08465.1 hypothetical protein B5F33_07130 [Collinsella sp. An2]